MASNHPILLRLFLVLLSFPSLNAAVSQRLIQLPTASSNSDDAALYCDSWRLSVETNNAGSWSTIPDGCTSFVSDYMTGDHYLSDSAVVASDSLLFANTVALAGDGMDAWVFDIDETLLSNLAFFELVGFRSKFNETTFDFSAEPTESPALPASLTLYNELKQMGFTLFLLTGRDESARNATVENLLSVGYSGWKELILRGDSDADKTATLYKSEKRAELIEEGYKIHGSSGDQWSDLLGFAVADRSFKLPNPLYYIA